MRSWQPLFKYAAQQHHPGRVSGSTFRCVLCGKLVAAKGGQRKAHAGKHRAEGHRITEGRYGYEFIKRRGL